MNHEFWNEIGNLYYMFGAYKPAIHAYLRSIKLENTFGRSYSNLALAYVQTGKYAEAIQIYLRGIELLQDDREKAETWNRLGVLYRQVKNYEQALDAYRNADRILPQDMDEAPLESRPNPVSPLSVAMPEIDLQKILAQGKGVVAIEENPLPSIPSQAEPCEMPGISRSVEEAESLPLLQLKQGLEADPVGSSTGAQSEWKLAYTVESYAIEPPADPRAGEVSISEPVSIDETALTEEKTEEAVQVSLNESDAGMDMEAMELSDELDNFQFDAVFYENNTEYELETPAQNEFGLNDIACASQIPQKNNPSSEEKLEIDRCLQAVRQNPRNYRLLENLGEAYKSAGWYEDAIDAFQKTLSMNPENAMCHYRLGLVYAAQQRSEDAIQSFQKVIDITPQFARAYASLSSQYRKLGLEDIAKAYYEKAQALQVDDESDYNKACMAALGGNHDRALELLEVALQNERSYLTWAQHDSDFHCLQNDVRFQSLLSAHAGSGN